MPRRSKMVMKKMAEISEMNKDRFMERVEKDEVTGCWKWKGALGANNYPQINFRGRTEYAHRVAWALWRGDLEGAKKIFRTRQCAVGKNCVNPDHLEEGGSGKYYAELRRGQYLVAKLVPEIIDLLTHLKGCMAPECSECTKVDGVVGQLKEARLSKPPKRGRPPKENGPVSSPVDTPVEESS